MLALKSGFLQRRKRVRELQGGLSLLCHAGVCSDLSSKTSKHPLEHSLKPPKNVLGLCRHFPENVERLRQAYLEPFEAGTLPECLEKGCRERQNGQESRNGREAHRNGRGSRRNRLWVQWPKPDTSSTRLLVRISFVKHLDRT